MNEELKDWTESLGKKASDYEPCMICTKQIDELKKEIKGLRLALQSHGQIVEMNAKLKKHLDFLLDPYSSPEEVTRRRFEVYEALERGE